MDCTHKLETPITFQASLHWKALLTASALYKPNPPLLFGLQTLSQAISGMSFSILFFLKISIEFIQVAISMFW